MNAEMWAGFTDTVKSANAVSAITAAGKRLVQRPATLATVSGRPARTAVTAAVRPAGTTDALARTMPQARIAPPNPGAIAPQPIQAVGAQPTPELGLTGRVGSWAARGLNKIRPGTGTSAANALMQKGDGAAGGVNALQRLGRGTLAIGGTAAGIGGAGLLAGEAHGRS